MAADVIDFSQATARKSVAVSGGFDCLHGGHLDLFRAAAKLGPVTVILNSDAWLVGKKGFFYLPYKERRRILKELRDVSEVVSVDDRDGTVCEALERIRPAYFANGGDRTDHNTPELTLCQRLGIQPVFGIGGNKTNSSSTMAKRAKVKRDWGTYEVLADLPWAKVKRLIVHPGSHTSKQKHRNREEYWFTRDGVQMIERGKWHRLSNEGHVPLEVIEVQLGDCREDDIVRA